MKQMSVDEMKSLDGGGVCEFLYDLATFPLTPSRLALEAAGWYAVLCII